MTDLNPCVHLDAVCDIACAAGRRILEIYEREFKVEHKDDCSPLTEADRVAHELLTSRLQALMPALPVLSEESVQVAYEKRTGWKRFWLVDPLDGTKEFINRNGEFTVNIALIEDQRPVLGVVHVPVARATYFACVGQGAFKQQGVSAARTIRSRRYVGGKPIVVASRSHAGKETEAFLKSIGDHDVVSMGSALKICLVAEGAADVYPRLGPTMEWDTAAAQCVVELAGGNVTDLDRRPLVYNKPDLHNPWFIVSGAGNYNWHQYIPTA